MQITDRIHALKIPFQVPVSPEMSVDRFAFVYLVFGDKIHLIDSGVSGAERIIRDYIEKQGRDPKEISTLLLTHSHPDHIGAAQSIKNQTGCTVFAHKEERNWIEDVELQCAERPVPGFLTLVQGPVGVDRPVEGGEVLELEKSIAGKAIHTPGHSRGSLSLLLEEEKSLFTADALPLPGDLPIYDDITSSLASIGKLQGVKNIDFLFSSWEPPIQGQEKIAERMEESAAWLERIHCTVISHAESGKGVQQDIMELCRKVVKELGLPPFAANPLVAKAFASSLAVMGKQNHR